MTKRTVLIVDDELTLLRTLRDALRRNGDQLEVLTAGRADEALELMQLTTVDLVVTDFRMPGQDGISFIAHISQKYPNTRCILMTAHGDSETKSKSLANGAVSFIEKPFDLKFFISEVNRHLSVSGFTGRSLVGFSLLDILQLVSMSQQSVTITVHSKGGAGSLFIEDGVLIHSETDGGLNGMRAAYKIVSWSDGDIASSRGVTDGTERSINMPLMTFLMEAAKYQDEVNRLRPLHNVRDVVKEWTELPGVAAAAVLDVAQGAEVYGDSAEKGVARMQIGKAIMAAYKAISNGVSENGEPSFPSELTVSLPTTEYMALSLLDGRFLALLATHDKAAIEPAKASFAERKSGLVAALSEYAEQIGAAEGSLESLNFEEVEDSLDLGGIGDS
ncbi:MAG: response regulator [Proteobacteria bacterium]|nr:response regulator [Pseudomonadota bacterium]